MFNNITLTSSMRSNLYALKNLTTQMNKTQNRLASGLKINSAIDNASSYYQARALNNRASDLDALLDSMGQSIQTISTAVKGLEKSGEMLEQAAVIAEAAYEAAIIPEKAWFEAQVGPNGAVVTTAQELKDAIAANKETICVYGKIDYFENQTLTMKAGQKLVGTEYFTGYTGNKKFSEINFSYLQTVTNSLISDLSLNANKGGYALKVGGKTTLSNIDYDYKAENNTNNSAAIISYGQMFNLSGNININASFINCSKVISCIYNYGGSTLNIDNGAKVYINSGNYNSIHMFSNKNAVNIGKADIYIRNIGSSQGIGMDTVSVAEGATISTTQGSFLSKGYSGYVSPTANLNYAKLKSLAEFEEINKINWNSPTEIENKFDEQYATVMNSFDEIVEDSSYQGINLITGGSLTTMFNENRTHSFVVQGEDMRAESLGITIREWNTRDDIAQSIKEIKNAMGKVRDMVESLGNNLSIIQTRENFTDKLIDVLETGADDLVLADMNEESANYLALQTRNNLAVNALSLAALSGNAVLKLF